MDDKQANDDPDIEIVDGLKQYVIDFDFKFATKEKEPENQDSKLTIKKIQSNEYKK